MRGSIGLSVRRVGLAASFGATVVAVPACGEEGPKGTVTQPTGVEVVAVSANIPKCNAHRKGIVYYAADEQEFFYCDGSELQPIDLEGQPDPDVVWLVATSAASLADCSNGGVLIHIGPDLDGDGELGATEVASTAPVCFGGGGGSSDDDDCDITTVEGVNTVICGDGNNVTITVNPGGGGGSADSDGDGVPDNIDVCPGFDDTLDANDDGIPNDCQECDDATEVKFGGLCYYLDGSGGVCDPGYGLAPQSVLTQIADDFLGKTYKHQVSLGCCIWHLNQAAEGQDWGFQFPGQCNAPGPFVSAPLIGGANCNSANLAGPLTLTLCVLQ